VPSPVYEKLPDSTNRLNTKIDITPLKRMSDRVEAEFLFNGGRYGYNLGNTFTNRNIFKQAAALQIKLNWSILFDGGRNAGDDKGIQNQEFKAGVSLIYPRIVSPFDFPNLAKFGVPHTTFSTNFSLFYQKGLVQRRSWINSVTYDFFDTRTKQHSITPINIEFSSGTIDPVAKAELLKQNRFSYVYLIGRTTFTSGSQYTFQYNSIKLNTFENFYYFRGSLDMGGERQFVFRINPGVGIPYGNSDQLVFEKNFYAGGANDIRAWLPRTLGPGQFNRASYGADTNLRSRLKYLDQFGEIKIIGNVEYRYKIADNFFGSKLKGALFTDFGNVWRLHDEVESPGGSLSLITSYNQPLLVLAPGYGWI
jgi:outer membrane protein insertion porin family